MTIAIDASRAVSPRWGGPENYSYFLIKNLVSLDNRNNYRLYINAPFQRNIDYPFNNVKEILIRWPRFWTQGGLALECWKNPPNVLFIPAHTLPVIRKRNVSTVVTIHDLGAKYLENFYKFPGRIYLNRSTEYCAKYADHIIAVSRSTKNDLIKKFNVSEKRISVIYEGYEKKFFYAKDKEEIERVKKKYSISKQYFLSVGTVQPRKNYCGLIRAFNKLLANSRKVQEPSLIIVGKKGWLDKEIYSLPKKLGIEPLVKFLGHIPEEDLSSLYSGSLCFIFPSFYEGFGLVILEAMACGAPVISSNTSSLPEVVGNAGIFIDPYNIETITAAMQRILESPDLQKKLVGRGFLQAQKFSWEKCAKETLGVLEKVGAKQED